MAERRTRLWQGGLAALAALWLCAAAQPAGAQWWEDEEAFGETEAGLGYGESYGENDDYDYDYQFDDEQSFSPGLEEGFGEDEDATLGAEGFGDDRGFYNEGEEYYATDFGSDEYEGWF